MRAASRCIADIFFALVFSMGSSRPEPVTTMPAGNVACPDNAAQ